MSRATGLAKFCNTRRAVASLAAYLLIGSSIAANAPVDLIPLPAQAVMAPVVDCRSLATRSFVQSPGAEFKVLSATIEPAAGDRAEFCLIQGYVSPQVQFQLRMPTSTYVGRYLQGGCGAMCGVIGTTLSPSCDDQHAYAGSFAVSFNNMGHIGASGGDATWASGAPELRKDFAYRADHVTAVVAKTLITAFYGQPPRWSYFQGCSNGGREALMEAQRYPRDFNGIVAGSSVSMPAVIGRFIWEAKVGLTPSGEQIMTPDATALLHDAVLSACDALDGVKDGQIDDPRRCHFDPGRLACKRGATGHCLTQEQVESARKLYDGPRDTAGHRLFPGGEAYGSELVWSSEASFTRTGKFAAEAFLKYLLFPGELAADFTWRDWQFDLTSFRRAQKAGAIFDASDPDLRGFRDTGGKIILWQGAADNAAGIYGMLDYYQAVRDVVGGLAATRNFSRFFLVPGVYHCRGGYVPYEEDFLGAIVNWVERGQPADAVLATATLGDGMVRRRSVYAYPVRAKYVGGDINAAQSFVAEAPSKEPDDHFEWAGKADVGRLTVHHE